MLDIIAIGELLIDMFSRQEGTLAFNGAPGGAPCNLAAQAARLGSRVAIICKLGEDYFGKYLRNYVRELGIDDSYISFTAQANTTLAFVTHDETNNRAFSFYRNPGADMLLTPQDLPKDLLLQARCVAYGGVALSEEPARSTLLCAVSGLDMAKQIIAYDPNIREALWSEGAQILRTVTLEGMRYANVVKLADNELRFLMQTEDLTHGAFSLLQRYRNIRFLAITAGEAGAYLPCGNALIHVPSYPVCVTDTTGAGDSFFGALLYCFLQEHCLPWECSLQQQLQCVRYANMAGSLTATAEGAIPAMPNHQDITQALAQMLPCAAE